MPRLVEPSLTAAAATAAGNATAVPASQSAEAQQAELRLDDVSHPEAVRAMLDFIYGESTAGAGPGPGDYNPSSEEVNRDVLRLAQQFQIAPLLDQASKWLLRGLSTSNALERLQACEEFGLTEVREKILEQLVLNPEALFVLAKDPEMTKVPAVLQDLLVRILKLLGCDPSLLQAQS